MALVLWIFLARHEEAVFTVYSQGKGIAVDVQRQGAIEGVVLRLQRVIKFLGFLPDEDELTDRLGIRGTPVQEIAQIQGTLLVLIRAMACRQAHGDESDQGRGRV